EAQREAVLTTEGAVRVAAGAGTGKTRALTARFCHLVSALGIAPRNILCATFTNRAAHEMQRRVRAVLGDLDLGFLGTFHSFCVQLLREDIHRLHYPKNFLILDVEDQKQLLLKIFGDMGLTLREITVRRTIDEVLEAKKLLAQSYIDHLNTPDGQALAAAVARAGSRDEEIFLRYLQEQRKCFGCDFNDLINFALYLLERAPDIRRKWQDRMQYVMVDEFQDVSGRQYKIARILAEKHGNLFIVGDPDQTIYSWRDAHVELFLDFDKVYPNAKTLALTTNYRSTPEILAAAGALIAKNTLRLPHALVPVKPSGRRPLYCHARNGREEAEWICAEIEALRAGGAPLGSVAILYRAHHLTRALEESLIEHGLPYRIFSGIEFYGRREIKDLVCYLRMVTAGDDIAFLRTVQTPPRRVGKKKLDALKACAAQRNLPLYDALKENLHADWLRGSEAQAYVRAVERAREMHRAGAAPGDVFQVLLVRSGYEEYIRLLGDQERLDNVAELTRAVAALWEDADATLEDFLARVALLTNLDREDARARETVKLMTVHTAKGMEFPHVFVCGLSEGIFPGRRIDTPEAMEEERRLAYVAMTRAADRLYLSDAAGGPGNDLYKYPSRFLFDMKWENLEIITPPDAAPEEDAQRHIACGKETGAHERPVFEAGARIMHPVFGAGTIAELRFREACYVIRFDALPTERSIRFGTELRPQAHI
ncbi:MAG: ATP-dependent helicase, partial [Oscillospiraceae bacterium]|nr:ATP-dependent helicase [Oscillospiraceae bacterium]